MKFKKIVILLLMVVTAILASSCAKENENGTSSDSKRTDFVTFNAEWDADLTRTYLSGVRVNWEMTDSVSLWYGTLGSSMSRDEYFVSSINDSDARIATLKGLASPSTDYIAVYPLKAAQSCTPEGTVTVNLPLSQTIKQGSFGHNANVAVSYSSTTDLLFTNIGGLVAFKVEYVGGRIIKKIRLTGTSAMSGEVEITPASFPDISRITDANNFISLDCGEGLEDTDDLFGSGETFGEDTGEWETKTMTKSGSYAGPGQTFYLVSLPGSHTGFVLTFIDKGGKAARLKSTHAFTIERNSNTLIANVSLTDAMFKSDPQVYINEVDCKNKKIELYNPNNESVDLSGWLLTKDEHSWAFPIGSAIPAKGYCVVNCKQSDCSTGPMFGLSGDKGFDLKLSNGGLVDRIDNLSKITVIGSTETFGRKTNGSAEWVVFSKGTIYEAGVCDGDNSKGTIKGDEPVVPTSVVLNEIDGNVKFIEFYNKGTEAVSLEGWTLYKDEEQVWLGNASHSIAAGSYFTIYSSKSSSIPAGAPTFSGGISPKKSVRVDIKNADGKTADTFTRGSSPWGTDLSSCSDSFGRTPDGTGSWKLITATPNSANGASKGDIPQN